MKDEQPNINFKQILNNLNIRPTFQRIKILEYLYLNNTHPDVDEIYNHLFPIMPTLSKTTVYNTLKLFIKFKIVEEIKIKNTEIRYDLITNPHGHFECRNCGTIYNFNLSFDCLKSEDLKNFIVDNKSVYFSGICPKCK